MRSHPAHRRLAEWAFGRDGDAVYALPLLLALGGCALVAAVSIPWTPNLTGEDGFTEWATVVLYVAACVGALRRVDGAGSRGTRLGWLAGAAALFTLAMEEIDWGFRWIKVSVGPFFVSATPPAWLLNPENGQASFHNRHWLDISDLYLVGVVGACTVLPLVLDRLGPRLSTSRLRAALPTPSVLPLFGVASVFLVVRSLLPHDTEMVEEFGEMSFAYAMMLWAWVIEPLSAAAAPVGRPAVSTRSARAPRSSYWPAEGWRSGASPG